MYHLMFYSLSDRPWGMGEWERFELRSLGKQAHKKTRWLGIVVGLLRPVAMNIALYASSSSQ
jgi:hypothetical protein